MLVDARDMHIYTNLRLQEIYGNRKKTVESHLLDYYLNKAVNVYIESKFSSDARNLSFDDIIKRVDDLKDCKQRDNIKLFKFDDQTVFGYLPQRYFHYASARANIGCEINNINEPSNYYYAVAGIDKISKVRIDNTDIVNCQNLNYTQTNNTDFIYINYILSYFPYITPDYTVECYYERYGDLYKPNKLIFILISNVSNPPSDMNFGGVIQFTNFDDKGYNIKGDTDIKSVELFPFDNIPDILDNAYYNRNRIYKPIISIENDRIYLYTKDIHNKFYANSINLYYISRPTPISLANNTICELKNREDICDIAVSLIKGDIGDETFQLTEFNNNKNI